MAELTPHPAVGDAARVLEVAERAAREAGEVLLGYLGRLGESQVGSKGISRDLVTEADVASERLLVAALRLAGGQPRADGMRPDEPNRLRRLAAVLCCSLSVVGVATTVRVVAGVGCT